MLFDQSSTPSSPASQDQSNPASTPPATCRSLDDSSPSIIASSLQRSESHIPPSSHLDPPRLSIPDHAPLRGTVSSDHHRPIDENDIVVAVMGLTGAGKSSFINTAAGRKEIAIVNNLKSQTHAVQPVRCIHPDGRQNIVLVDTPGFDDTCLSDAQILRIIANWLKDTYQNNIKLAGLLYLHRISDVRMAGAPLRNLSVFKDLCGDSNMKNIVLVTTMWDEVQDELVGSKREEELLAEFWKDMMRLGSRACRFQGTRESAWEIIDRLNLEESRQRRAPLQIQREMVDRGLPLHKTTAAKTLLRLLAQFAGECRRVWANLRNKARRKPGPKEPSGGLRLRAIVSRSSTLTSNSSVAHRFMASSTSVSTFASRDSSPLSSPAESTLSDCSRVGRRDTLFATIKILRVAHEMADIAHIPILRGVIGIAIHIAKRIEEIGGTHHAITQVMESSGWLLHEITQYAAKSNLSKDMKRALGSFQRELSKLQIVVTEISGRRHVARFLLHDGDVEAIRACTASINAVYNKLEVKLAMDSREAIARLEAQLIALCKSTESRQCECGMLGVLHDETQEDGQASGSMSRPL